ncbi:hypothetical protein JOL79_08345 [Microbispora sp. RL4-1S]|uniref:Uncharacterized protein n=1 Tax=Microbispora oryzae TaxID=2806554 RepID=A0A941AJ45_9ACTN|nr:hypothetical protein [Microbispora oryzae]MBP2703813.1 hypothetical protein [Microbispora oryzae]
MVGVQDEFGTCETWPFECLHCLRAWEQDYLVQRRPDGQGHDVTLWTRDGVAVPPPWSGAFCPECGSGSVTTFPTGLLERHGRTAPAGPGACGAGGRACPSRIPR